MEKMTKIIIAIMVVIILIIIITIVLLNLNNTLIEKEQKEADNPETVAFIDIEELTNKNLFFQIQYNINEYYQYLQEKNEEAIKSISKENIVTLKNQNNYNFKAMSMYVLDKISNITVYVEGVTLKEGIEDIYYLIVNIDYSNNTFEIINSSKEEFENAKNSKILSKYKQDIIITKNQYNRIQEINITDFEILQYYFEDYKYKALYKTQEAFEIIDNEYRQKKFGNSFETYKQYINDNINRLKDANIVKHGITRNGQYCTYIAYDNYNNYYKIIETDINKYTIILDNYTIETNEFLGEYNKLSAKEKVHTNIDKIIKLINEKNYTELYQSLNNNFKNTYFKTQVEFESYVKNKFFDNNLVGAIEIEEEGEVYIVKVPYKESLSTAADVGKITINMKLGEGTKFEISFNMQ